VNAGWIGTREVEGIVAAIRAPPGTAGNRRPGPAGPQRRTMPATYDAYRKRATT
jgi:hypothetical protein